METVKRKINALKDEIERKDEGKVSPLLVESTRTKQKFSKFFKILTLTFLDITVLREKLKKEQMERERYENEANHQSRKVKYIFFQGWSRDNFFSFFFNYGF